jgi:deferrochelatase/peroxidase EfeB
MSAPVDFNDIQGIARFGYGKLTEASFWLLNIRDASAARSWLASAPVTTAIELDVPPETALQVALTCDGLQSLGVSDEILAGFSDEFLSGMTEESRSRRLGDVGASAPQYWQWGRSGKVPHMLVMLYGQPGHLASWTQYIKGAHWDGAFQVLDCLLTSDLQNVEPFGFADGISQPTLDWDRQRSAQGDQLVYSNLLALGEFLLGYPNEYGKYTDRPLLNPGQPLSDLLPFAEDVTHKRDLGRNGTYLVLRQLKQDVRGFWRFLDMQTTSDPQSRQKLAERMVGRKMNGDPLLPLNSRPLPGIDPRDAPQNQFTYDSDGAATRCPFGAHIRRANPRNADLPSGSVGLIAKLLHTLGFGSKKFRDDVMASTRFHRLLRRGREYGPGLSPEQAIAESPDTGEHGIYFICLAANISRQFEFVQNAWVMSTKFNALTGESDPLLGNRQPIPGCNSVDTFSVPQETGVCRRIHGMPQFITVRGGAYFFLPSLSALRYLTALG